MKKVAALTLCLFVLFAVGSAVAQDSAQLYKTKCAACHGADGKAETPVAKKQSIKPFSDPSVQKQTDAQLISMIGEGGEKKLATHEFAKKGLTPDQVKALATYVKELGKK